MRDTYRERIKSYRKSGSNTEVGQLGLEHAFDISGSHIFWLSSKTHGGATHEYIKMTSPWATPICI